MSAPVPIRDQKLFQEKWAVVFAMLHVTGMAELLRRPLLHDSDRGSADIP